MRRILLAVAGLVALTACTSRTAGAPQRIDCARTAVSGTVTCLESSLSRFWTRTIGKPVVDTVVVSAAPAAVPAQCRYALKLGTAFTCSVDRRVYLTSAYVAKLRDTAPRSDAQYRFAATLAHEMGHVVQFAAHDPAIKTHPTFAQSQTVEQQADCLSGVWATGVGLPAGRLLAGARQVLHIVDNPQEERTHGTPARRLAAIRRGLAGGTPRACGLTLH